MEEDIPEIFPYENLKSLFNYFKANIEEIKAKSLSEYSQKCFVECYSKIEQILLTFENLENSFGSETFLEQVLLFLRRAESIKNIKLLTKNYSVKFVNENVIDNILQLRKDLKIVYYYETEVFSTALNQISGGNKIDKENEKLYEELDIFVEIGEELAKDQKMIRIKNELGNLKTKGIASIFATMIGPSYIGKTQSAFALSQMMNVIYVNLMGRFSKTESLSMQVIYRALSSITDVFYDAIRCDIDITKYSSSTQTAKNFVEYTMPLKTVGLIFAFLRTRAIHMSRPGSDKIKKWFHEISSINSILVPKMTITNFVDACKDYDIDLNETLMFIDEFSIAQKDPVEFIKFLRNLCRFLNIPTIVSSTNSEAKNLIGKEDSLRSRMILSDPVRWVKVITDFPLPDLKY